MPLLSLSFVPLAVLGIPSFDLHQPLRQKRVLDSDSESDVDPDVRRSLLEEFPKDSASAYQFPSRPLTGS